MNIRLTLSLLLFSSLSAISAYAQNSSCPEGQVLGSVSNECIPSSGTWENDTKGSGTWTMDAEGHLTISGTGAMPGYELSGANTPWNTKDVTHMEITNGITSISTLGLYPAGNVSLSLADSIEKIEGYAFYHAKVGNLTLPQNLKEIGWIAFHCHDGVSRVVIPESVETLVSTAWGSGTPMTIYCPQKHYAQCKGNNITPYLYKKVGDEYIVYDTDGNIKEVFKSYDDFSEGKVFAKYTKNNDGSYTLRNADGKLIGFKGKRIYTVEEATLLAKPNGNTFKLRYR